MPEPLPAFTSQSMASHDRDAECPTKLSMGTDDSNLGPNATSLSQSGSSPQVTISQITTSQNGSSSQITTSPQVTTSSQITTSPITSQITSQISQIKPLAKLHADLVSHNITAKLAASSISIVQPTQTGYTVFDVVPWRADPNVPVLYFMSFEETEQDGLSVIKPQSLADYKAQTEIDPYFAQYISPTEHPLTALPAWFLHPCRSQEWLDDTHGSWWLWLQYFGGSVGLQLAKITV